MDRERKSFAFKGVRHVCEIFVRVGVSITLMWLGERQKISACVVYVWLCVSARERHREIEKQGQTQTQYDREKT